MRRFKPGADWPGAMSLVLPGASAPGSVEGNPAAAPPITDLIAGLYCAYGIVSALRARDHMTAGKFLPSGPNSHCVRMIR